MGVERLSLEISNKIGSKLNKSQEEKAVINYGLFVMLHTSITIIVTIIVGIITNSLKEMMIICTCSAILKRYSGGVHASSPMRCTIIGVSMCMGLALTTKTLVNSLNDVNLLLCLLIAISTCYYVLYKRCPIGSKQKPLKNENKRILLRKKSFNIMNLYSFIVLVLFIADKFFKYNLLKTIYISIIFGALIQIFSLSKFGGKVLSSIDNILNIENQKK